MTYKNLVLKKLESINYIVGGLNWCRLNKVNRHVSNQIVQGLMDAWPSIFSSKYEVCVYICSLYIQYIVIDIYVHINQLWITGTPKNCNKQLSSCMEQSQLLVSTGSACMTKFYSSGYKIRYQCSRICNGVLWQGKRSKRVWGRKSQQENSSTGASLVVESGKH